MRYGADLFSSLSANRDHGKASIGKQSLFLVRRSGWTVIVGIVVLLLAPIVYGF